MKAALQRWVPGLVASAVGALLLPAGPLQGTLSVLPIVLCGFIEIERWLHRLTGVRAPKWVDVVDAGLLGGIVVLALVGAALVGQAAGPWSLERSSSYLFAALAALLAQRTVLVLVVARRLLEGRESPERPHPVFFWLPLLVYLALMPWAHEHRPPDGDEPYLLLLTHSLAHDFDRDLANNYADGDSLHFMGREIEPQPGDPAGSDGQLYSRHNVLLPLLLAPAYRLMGVWGALLIMVALTAAVAYLTLRVGGRCFPTSPTEALWAYSLVAFAPPLLLYSYQVWVEVPAAALLLLALDRSFDDAQPAGRRRWLTLLFPVVGLILLKLRFAAPAAGALVVAWRRAAEARRRLIFAAVAAATALIAIAGINQLLYQNPLKYRSLAEIGSGLTEPLGLARGLGGLFFDSSFGLFAVAPIWMILIAAAPILWMRSRRLLLDLLLIAVPYLLLVAARSRWYGDWSPPFRYPLLLVPLLGIALIPLLETRHRAAPRALLTFLGAATAGLTLAWLVVPGWTYNLADGTSTLLRQLDLTTATDIGRFFPSFIRPRAATWVWPLVSLTLIPALWWLPTRRSRYSVVFGLAAFVVGVAALGLAARFVPTRVVHVEDTYVRKHTGSPYPEQWSPTRLRFRAGWLLADGERIEIPVVAGGADLSLTVHYRLLGTPRRPVVFDAAAGGSSSSIQATDREWTSATLRFSPWPRGEQLIIRRADGMPAARVPLVIDKLVFDWSG